MSVVDSQTSMIRIALRITFTFQGEERAQETKVFDEEDLEKERQDMVQRLEAKNRKTLQFKRSFFVRMVSDPKIYNPKIVKLKQDMSLVEETPSTMM